MARRNAPTLGLVVLILLLGGGWIVNGISPLSAAHSGSPRHGTSASRGSGATPPAPAPSPSTKHPLVPAKAPLPKKNAGTRTNLGPYGAQRMTGSRGVALTFDDGPHPIWTPQMLDRLRAAKVKATFCLVGTEVHDHPALVARIVREGHTLCNHTWHHELDLGSRPAAEIRANILRTNQEILRAVPGARIKYFRQPGGKWTPALIKVVRELGMVPLHWDVDPSDWEKPGAAAISSRVINHARAGSIVLMHDGGGDRSGTLAACPAILANLKKRYGIVQLH